MTGRSYGPGLGRTPLEFVGIALALAVMGGLGLLWGSGVVIGSILGATLPGTGGEGVVALLHSFPDVGRAWVPPIPSGLMWAFAVTLVVVFSPLLWRLIRAGRLADEGAQWASNLDLRDAGLLVSDHPLPHAAEEVIE